MTAVELRNVSKSFGRHPVCRDINLAVGEGEFITLLGSSGCGKTTTLNLIAGLEDASAGDILMNGRRVNDLSPVQRDVAMVFQNYALYPHMTVAQNIGFTLKMRKLRANEIRERVERVAQSLELAALLDRLPTQLSGGQQQRVAIGRALVREPRVFLFDEPFSNLDAGLRVRMRVEVKELHQRLGVTSVFVTHDQEEALSISDRVAVMNLGVVEQVGTPEEIYSQPATRYVAGFIGSPRIELCAGALLRAADGVVCRIGSVTVPMPPGMAADDREVEIGVRPEHVRLGDRGFPAKVRQVQPVGPTTHVTLDWEGGALMASLPGFMRLDLGSAVKVEFDPAHLLVFDRKTGKRLGPPCAS